MNAKTGNTIAGLIFISVAIYTYIATPGDWPMAAMWAAIGAVFVGIGLSRKKPSG